jgi:uncharacterized protein YozE (UPF0346 family)
LKDRLFDKRGTEILRGILLHVGVSTTQLTPIARDLFEIMNNPDRRERAENLKVEMFAHDLYSRHHLPEEEETWELLIQYLVTESEFISDSSGDGNNSELDGQER